MNQPIDENIKYERKEEEKPSASDKETYLQSAQSRIERLTRASLFVIIDAIICGHQ